MDEIDINSLVGEALVVDLPDAAEVGPGELDGLSLSEIPERA